MRKGLMLAGLLCLVMAASAWAAGSQEAEPAMEKVTQFVWWFGEWNEPRGTTMARKFEEAHPQYKVDAQPQVGRGILDKIQVALRSGSTPDALNVAIGWNIPFAASGFLTELDGMIRSAGLPVADFYEATWTTARYEGKAYGIPYRTESHGFIYNRGMYEAVGLNPDRPPETWAELLDYSRRLTTTINGKQVYGYGVTGGGEINNMIYLVVPMIWMNGGSVLSADNTRATINQSAAVEAVKRYTDYYTTYKVSPESTMENDGGGLRRLFNQEALAQMQQGSYAIPQTQKENPGIQVGAALVPHPAGKDPAAILGGWNYTIPKDARNKEAAWAFIQFMVEPESIAYFTDTFPARKSAMSQPRFQDPILQPFIDMLAYTRMTPGVEAWPQISGIIFTEIQNVLLGRKTPQGAMDDAAAQINALL